MRKILLDDNIKTLIFFTIWVIYFFLNAPTNQPKKYPKAEMIHDVEEVEEAEEVKEVEEVGEVEEAEGDEKDEDEVKGS